MNDEKRTKKYVGDQLDFPLIQPNLTFDIVLIINTINIYLLYLLPNITVFLFSLLI